MMSLVLRAWACDVTESQLERLVLVFLASHCGRGKQMRVVPRDVALALHCSARKLDAALASLASTGVISAVRWQDSGAWSVKVQL